MFSNKLKSLLVFALVLLLTCSFTVFVNAEDASDVASAVSEAVSETVSEAQSEAASEVSTVSSEATSDEKSTAAGDESTAASDASEAGTTSKTPGWLGWAIVGGIVLVVALWLFISVKRKTPFGQKVAKFFKDYKSEISKVVWLSKQDLVKKTIVVLVTIVVACVVIGLLDYGFTKLVSLIK
jgi:preprotein translocase SecE subunit